jgi:hypothetical protein
LTVIALVGAWLLTAISQVFRLSEPLTTQNVVGVIKRSLFTNPYDFTIGLVVKDPVHSISALVLVVGYLVCFVLVRRARARIKYQSLKLKDAAASYALISDLGIGGRWPHAAKDGSGAPWNDLSKEILRPENTVVDILGANGIETFGERGSPLYDALQTFGGTVRVVLLHPTSAEMGGRARAVGMEVRAYKKAIMTSQARVRELRRQHHAIDGRFYDGVPNWKLIITSRTAWVQYYVPGGKHVNETPVYRFDATDGGTGLYQLFHMEFDRIWRRCENTPMNLSDEKRSL